MQLDPDINVAIKYCPRVMCVRCGYHFKLAQRCPECGQLYEFVDYFKTTGMVENQEYWAGYDNREEE